MRGIVVVTGLDQLPPSERWPRLIAPLREQLADSRLGFVLDIDVLRREAVGENAETTEVAVELAEPYYHYGRELIARVVEQAGIQRIPGKVPERWRKFACADYFESALAEQGYWDEGGQCWYVWTFDRVYESIDLPLLTIGSPMVDGIDWGYRLGHTGIWAYYPTDLGFVWLAPTADTLAKGWQNGTISV